jgi:hypothetical protein
MCMGEAPKVPHAAVASAPEIRYLDDALPGAVSLISEVPAASTLSSVRGGFVSGGGFLGGAGFHAAAPGGGCLCTDKRTAANLHRGGRFASLHQVVKRGAAKTMAPAEIRD